MAVSIKQAVVKFVSLLSEEFEDPDFVDIVVTTHKLYIMKTEELVSKLIAMYPN